MLSSLNAASPEVWDQLADTAVSFARRGDTRGALNLLGQAIEKARSIGEIHGEWVSLNAAATVHLLRGDYWTALASGTDAFVLAQKNSNRHGMARAVTLFANSLGLLIPLENATDVLAGALSIARDARDADLQCRIHNLFGITYGDLRDFDEAELHFSCASQLDEHHPGLHQRWRIRANLANLQRKQADAAREAGDIEACQLYCERGRRLLYELFRKLERDENISMHLDVLFIAGLIEIAAGRSGAARIYFEEAWALAHAGKHRTVLPSLGVHLGYLNLSDGRMAVADQILTEALHEAMFYRPSPKAARLCELSAEWHRLQGDARGEAYFRSQALEARRDFDALKSAAGLQLAEVARMLKG